MTAPHLSIIIPAFNESVRIGATIEELRTFLPTLGIDWEIRVVDDGSTDETAAIVEHIGATDPRVIAQREPHRGKGGTVRAGMLATQSELRFLCDADLSMPVRELPRFLALVPTPYDIVIGSREGLGAARLNEPAYRHLMGRIFNGFVRFMAVGGIDDTQCGFKMFSGEAADLVFAHLTVEGWAFDIEALVAARRRGLSVHEMPIEWHFRELSRVSPLRDSMRMTWDLIRIRWNMLRGRYDV